MKASDFCFQPDIRRALDTAALIGIGAVLFQVAAIADMCRGAVAANAVVVPVVTMQMLAGRTFPGIHAMMILETGDMILLRAPSGMARQEFQGEGHAREKHGIAHGQHDFKVRSAAHALPSPGLVISVNSEVSHVSGAAFFPCRMCHTPSHAR